MTAPLFKEDQIITQGQVFHYLVIATPDTCTYNGEPAYLIKSLRPIATPPFFRNQQDVETQWRSLEDQPFPMLIKFLFPKKSTLRHKKTGNIYRIKITPDLGRLEATDTPAYAYECVLTGIIWMRSQVEMEDGRFEEFDSAFYPTTVVGS